MPMDNVEKSSCSIFCTRVLFYKSFLDSQIVTVKYSESKSHAIPVHQSEWRDFHFNGILYASGVWLGS